MTAFRNTFAQMIVVLAFLAGSVWGAHPVERPNILVILVDDLGYGDLSSYGATDIRSPNIDRLMEEGLRFDRFYSNCTVCSPTRASLLTGRYPDLVGVPGVLRPGESSDWGYFDLKAVTLPDMLKRVDYSTALIGKWHLGIESPNTPNDRGFDFFHGFLGGMMDDYYTHIRKGRNLMRRDGEVITAEGHATELFSDWSIDYLKKRQKEEEPFFLYLAYNAPHYPIQPPEAWLQKVKGRLPELDEERAKNVAFVEHLDHNIGRVLDTLAATGQAENTIVVFSSDNGGSLRHAQSNGDLKGGKQDHWEGGIRVATCVRWPGKVEPDRSSQVAVTMDLFPTLCEIAGVPVDHEINGLSLLPYLLERDGSSLENRRLIWMRREGGGTYQGRAYYAIREGPWKLQQSDPFHPMELYNLDTDPYEENAVLDEPKIRNRLRGILMQHIRRAGRVPWQAEAVE